MNIVRGMSQVVEDSDTFSSPYHSSSMDDSFHLLSRDSADLPDNDAPASRSQRNHISLTEQDEFAPCHSEEIAGELELETRYIFAHTP